MNQVDNEASRTTVSVVIPTYNSAQWLPSTFEALTVALGNTTWDAEIIVVNDGSTDGTIAVVDEYAARTSYPVHLLDQENKGRFRARWEGAQAAHSEWLLILDSRVPVHSDSLRYLQDSMATEPPVEAWNAHVVTDPSAPLVGRFWEVPTYVFWGTYLSNPRPMLIAPDNFDKVPKGTTCLFIKKELFEDACRAAWPEENAQLASDDTKLLRFIAHTTPIRIDPGFAATYRPRTNLKSFLSHSWDRGTMFVDSYAGTSALRNFILIALVVFPPLLLTLLVALVATGQGLLTLLLLIIALLATLSPALIAAAHHCPPRAVIAFISFLLPFGVVFWAGLARGLAVHRKSFTAERQSIKGTRA